MNRKHKTKKKNIEWQKKEKKKDCQQIINRSDNIQYIFFNDYFLFNCKQIKIFMSCQENLTYIDIPCRHSWIFLNVVGEYRMNLCDNIFLLEFTDIS